MDSSDVFIFEAQSNVMHMEDAVIEKDSKLSSSKRARPETDVGGRGKVAAASFKTTLMGMSSPTYWQGLGCRKERLRLGQGDLKYVEGSDGTEILFSEDLKKRLQKPWDNALILKNMGRPHSLNFMLAKLKQKWPLAGHWQLMDMEGGYFVARFQLKADLDMVLTEGPWVIANQYLVAQRWIPNFVPGEQEIQKMPVWIRMSRIPMEWMEHELLWGIGELLGNPCKIDPITEAQARGRFARLCIEIDTNKPLKGTLKVDGRRVKVEYESMGLICFNCGRIGHGKDSCMEGLKQTQATEASKENKVDNQPMKETNTCSYGPWLTVNYSRNGKYGQNNGSPNNGRQEGPAKSAGSDISRKKSGSSLGNEGKTSLNQAEKDGLRSGKGGFKYNNLNRGGTTAGGSRFDILGADIEAGEENNRETLKNITNNKATGNLGARSKEKKIFGREDSKRSVTGPATIPYINKVGALVTGQKGQANKSSANKGKKTVMAWPGINNLKEAGVVNSSGGENINVQQGAGSLTEADCLVTGDMERLTDTSSKGEDEDMAVEDEATTQASMLLAPDL
ncbi:hypothetical protein ACOSQ4_012684 [Xanthoceras sorbifolium]